MYENYCLYRIFDVIDSYYMRRVTLIATIELDLAKCDSEIRLEELSIFFFFNFP